MPLPPEPVATRWNTWLKTAFFCCENFEKIIQFVDEGLEEFESRAIASLKKMVTEKRDEIAVSLAVIKGDFTQFTNILTKLEKRNSLNESVSLVTGFADSLTDPYEEKFDAVLSRNPDWEYVREIAEILNGTSRRTNIDPGLVVKFKYQPIVSVDVERSFSQLKQVLAPQRESLTVEHVKHYMIVMWNDV